MAEASLLGYAIGRGSPAVHCDWVVTGLLLLLLHGGDDVDHALTVRRDAHLRPAVEMELPDQT